MLNTAETIVLLAVPTMALAGNALAKHPRRGVRLTGRLLRAIGLGLIIGFALLVYLE